MNPVTTPIATSLSLSMLLHGVAIAALLLVYEQTASTGQGVEIELIRSAMVSDQQETDVPRKNESLQPVEKSQKKYSVEKMQKESLQRRDNPQTVLTSRHSDADIREQVIAKKNMSAAGDEQASEVQKKIEQSVSISDEGESDARLMQSTNAAQQQHSIIELLHERISVNKEYPYIARRQRREGVATVGFVLHPDGSIENTRLLASSSTAMLDRAALTAVERIQPFIPAHDYLVHAEEFKVNVVFNLH